MSKRLLTSGDLSVVIEGKDLDAEIVRAFQEAPSTTKLGQLFSLRKDLTGIDCEDDEYCDTVRFLKEHGMFTETEEGR